MATARLYLFGPSGFCTMAPLRYAAKFDPFLSLDCAPTPSTLAQSKERKGSNFAIWQQCCGKQGRRETAADLKLLSNEQRMSICKPQARACKIKIRRRQNPAPQQPSLDKRAFAPLFVHTRRDSRIEIITRKGSEVLDPTKALKSHSNLARFQRTLTERALLYNASF